MFHTRQLQLHTHCVAVNSKKQIFLCCSVPFAPVSVPFLFHLFFKAWSVKTATPSYNHFLDPTGEESNRWGMKQCCLSVLIQ